MADLTPRDFKIAVDLDAAQAAFDLYPPSRFECCNQVLDAFHSTLGYFELQC